MPGPHRSSLLLRLVHTDPASSPQHRNARARAPAAAVDLRETRAKRGLARRSQPAEHTHPVFAPPLLPPPPPLPRTPPPPRRCVGASHCQKLKPRAQAQPMPAQRQKQDVRNGRTRASAIPRRRLNAQARSNHTSAARISSHPRAHSATLVLDRRCVGRHAIQIGRMHAPKS
eukprot:6203619-Pleurochrysis_carterae.AAC.3